MGKTLAEIVVSIVNEISIYFITFVSGLSLIVFIWGVMKYIWKGDSDESRKKGRQLMIWGIIGLFVMFSVWGLVGVLGKTFKVDTTIPQFDSAGTNVKTVDKWSDKDLKNLVDASKEVNVKVNKPILNGIKNASKTVGGAITDSYTSSFDYIKSLFVSEEDVGDN